MESNGVSFDDTLLCVQSYESEFSERSIGYHVPTNEKNMVNVSDMNGRVKGFSLTTSYPGSVNAGINEMQFLKKMACSHITNTCALSFSQKITPFFQLIIDIDLKLQPDYEGYWSGEDWVVDTGRILADVLVNTFPLLKTRTDFPLFVTCVPRDGVSIEKEGMQKLGCHFRCIRRCAYDNNSSMDWTMETEQLPIDLNTGLYVNVKEAMYIRQVLIQRMRNELPSPPKGVSFDDMVDEAIYKNGGLRFLHHGKKARKCGHSHIEGNCKHCSPVTPGFITSSRKYICKYAVMADGSLDKSFIDDYEINREDSVSTLIRTWWMLSIGLYAPLDCATQTYYTSLIKDVRSKTRQGEMVRFFKFVPNPTDFDIQAHIIGINKNAESILNKKKNENSTIEKHARNCMRVSFQCSKYGKGTFTKQKNPHDYKNRMKVMECKFPLEDKGKLLRSLTKVVLALFPHTTHKKNSIVVCKIRRRSDKSSSCVAYASSVCPMYLLEVQGGCVSRCLRKLREKKDDGYHSASKIYFQLSGTMKPEQKVTIKQKCWSSKCKGFHEEKEIVPDNKYSKFILSYLFRGYGKRQSIDISRINNEQSTIKKRLDVLKRSKRKASSNLGGSKSTEKLLAAKKLKKLRKQLNHKSKTLSGCSGTDMVKLSVG